jgi:ribosomal-protein-alanine N-acetyltransferase
LIPTELRGRRVLLRPLVVEDHEAWSEVRSRCGDWLTRWEPRPVSGRAEPTVSREVFAARVAARNREWQLGTGYGFGIYAEGRFAGEINLGTVQRGPFQNAYVGYWIDRALAGKGYMPEAVVAVCRFAFEDLGLHRIQISIIPRNTASRRVVEKLDLRLEGVAERYLQIAGVWEDHCRYAVTAEEWEARRDALAADWLA